MYSQWKLLAFSLSTQERILASSLRKNPDLNFPSEFRREIHTGMHTRQLSILLRKCSDLRLLKQGRILHQKVITSGFQNNISLCKNLINFYFSCQLSNSAKLVFQSIANPLDISLWNGLLAAYTKKFMFNEAFDLFVRLFHFPYLKPDSYTYPSVLKACGGLGRIDYGTVIHSHVIKLGFVGDVVVNSCVVGMYAKCGLFRVAVRVFDEMPERDVACWNTVISCYYQDGQCEKALDLFEKMKACGFEPDSVTFTTAISCCARLLDLKRGRRIYDELVRKGLLSDGFIQSALVDMYGKCGCLEMASEVFEKIPRKNLVTWNSMIAGYSLRGDSKSCIRLFLKMRAEGIYPSPTTFSTLLMACSKSSELKHGKFIHGYIVRNNIEADIFIYTSLVDLYFKCGNVASAEYLFKSITKRNVVEWNVMISGYVSVGSYFEALGIYSDMKEANVKPDSVTFTSTLAACSQLTALERGMEIHMAIKASKFGSNRILTGALLDMYAKCGAVNEARLIFNQLPERDLVSWTSMITAFGSHGQPLEALKLFHEMQLLNVKPDRVAFLAVMSACSHAGLLNEGYYYFNQMITDYGIQPTIAEYSCLIDLLGRAGRLYEAYAILQRNSNIREDIGLLSTLFSACHLHGDLELGKEIAEMLSEKDSHDQSTYITLANMYASVKDWEAARKVRLKMKKLGLRKNPGCTWIEIDKRIEAFFVEDKSIPQADQVYECLSIIFNHMEKDEVLSDTILNI